MYRLSQLRRGFQSPVLFGRELNRLYHRRGQPRNYNADGVRIFDHDWDNMVLLDACRYDMFERRNTLEGRLESRTSAGSTTVEFLRANLEGRDLRDTVYVTANPQLHRHRGEIRHSFHEVVDVWRDSGWDKTARTVLPETTTEYAVRAAKRHPNKRLLVHYIQPHYPFISSDFEFDKQTLHEIDDDRPDFWHRILVGDLSVDADAIWEAYDRNLDMVLESVSTLLVSISGKTIVTADHGNMVGDRAWPVPIREWGHPYGIYTEELVKVPWLIVQGDERRTITAEEPVADAREVEDAVLEERLQSLGYVE
jgi:hypothetical protein